MINLRRLFTTAQPEPMHHSSGIYTPLRAPWIVTDQNDSRFEKLTWQEAHAIAVRENRVTATLDLGWGQVAYQRDRDGRIEVAAFHHDSSD